MSNAMLGFSKLHVHAVCLTVLCFGVVSSGNSENFYFVPSAQMSQISWVQSVAVILWYARKEHNILCSGNPLNCT